MREVIVILGAFLASACTPKLSAYYYMSFVDVPGIKILEYGKADWWPLFGHEEMPIRYELKRDGYTLLLSVDVQHLGGKVMMLKTENSGMHVRVVSTTKEHDTPNSCGVSVPFGDRWTIYEMKEQKILRFWGKASAHCGKQESGGRILSDQMPGVLDYQIINDDGGLVAEERLNFAVFQNGTYLWPDTF